MITFLSGKPAGYNGKDNLRLLSRIVNSFTQIFFCLGMHHIMVLPLS